MSLNSGTSDSSPADHEAEASDDFYDRCDQVSANDPAASGIAKPQSLSEASPSDHKQSQLSVVSRPRVSLRRTQSQTALAFRPESLHIKEPATMSRRRSISQVPHLKESDSLIHPSSPMELDLERGMFKLKFAKPQHDLEQACIPNTSPVSHSSSSTGDHTSSGGEESPNSTSTSSLSLSNSNNDHDDSTQSIVEDNPSNDTSVDEEKAMLIDQIATLMTEKKCMEAKHAEEIASKEEVTGRVVSMYQVATEKIDDLESQLKQAGTKVTQKIISDPALSAELIQLRRTNKIQLKDLLELRHTTQVQSAELIEVRDSTQIQAKDLGNAVRRIEALGMYISELSFPFLQYLLSICSGLASSKSPETCCSSNSIV